MSPQLAVDFGTSNTLLAVWDQEKNEAEPLYIPELSRKVECAKGEASWLVPSLIHYAPDDRRWLGQQVMERGLYDSPRTFRWMKRYIAARNPAGIKINNTRVSFFDAGKAFLSGVLLFAIPGTGTEPPEVAFTVPVEAFEHYENWLEELAKETGISRFKLIDEPSAAALGYGSHIREGDVYILFDFGGGSLDISVLLPESTDSGRLCRVLGKAGEDLGGITVDQWLFERVLKENRIKPDGKAARSISRKLLCQCERAKEELSFRNHVNINFQVSEDGPSVQSELSSSDLDLILEEKGLESTIGRTIRSALRAAWEKGYGEEDIKAVFMVGGSSMLPQARKAVKRFFGKKKVFLSRPLDAVARGACVFAAGCNFFDHIQHDYAIRYVDPGTGEYKYHVIVRRGTPYPTEEPAARLTVKASHDSQEKLGLAIFEVGKRTQDGPNVELVFDPSGAARVVQVSPEVQERRTYFWMNEKNPTFLTADPPARKGEKRFEAEFRVDSNKRLLITVKDLTKNKMVLNSYPVVELR